MHVYQEVLYSKSGKPLLYLVMTNQKKPDKATLQQLLVKSHVACWPDHLDPDLRSMSRHTVCLQVCKERGTSL